MRYRELTEAVEDPFSAATLDFGVRYEQAVLDWFAALPPAVTGEDEDRPPVPS